MKKLIRYIFIPIFAILLMSHNVFAVEMAPNVHPIWANANPTCAFYLNYGGSGGQWVNNSFSNTSSSQDSTTSLAKINCDYPSGLQTLNTYAVYSFRIDNFNYNDSADSGWLATKAQSVSGSANWGVIGQTVSAMGSTGYQVDIYLYGQASTTGGGTFQLYNPLNSEEIFYLKPKERVTFVGASYWAVTTETDFEYDYNNILNSISAKLSEGNGYSYAMNLNLKTIITHISDISDKLDDISQDTADAINNGQSEATQDASDNSQTAGDTSKTQTEGATSNLLSVFGAFANVITNATPTNCIIDAPLNTSFSSDRFHVDLCGLNLPPAIGTLTSIIAVMVVVPFAISMFNKFIGIMESFQK